MIRFTFDQEVFMTYHKYFSKKQTLAFLLAGSLFLTGIPVYATDTDNSSTVLTAEDECNTTDADVDISDSGISSDKADLTVESENPDTDLSFEEDSEDSGVTTGSEEETFSAGDDEAVFSFGNEGDSEDGLNYILGRPMTEEERQAQLAPLQDLTPMQTNDTVSSDIDIAAYALYPPTYNAAEDGLVSSVKNQGDLSLCWAFSLASNFETSLLSRNLGYLDLSEEQLAYFWAHRVNDPLGNTPNDQIIRMTGNYHGTGNGTVASFFLSTWSGMTTEQKVPLSSTATVWPTSLAYDTDAYMQDAVFSQYSVDRTKQLLMNYYSVSVMIDMLGSYYCPDTAAYSCPLPVSKDNPVNHAVTIVGWDNTYSKENFPEASGVQENGAWIVKNSYGSSWGKNGYFYLSYEDLSISNLVCNTAVTTPAYPNNYFYDGSNVGTVTFPGSTIRNGYYISNIFKATAGNGMDEELGEIVTAVPQDNTQFQIQIYTNLTDSSNPVSGTPAYEEPLTYTQPLAGIHTIQLESPVKIPAGTLYSVVLKLTDGSQKCYVEKSTYSNPSVPASSWFQTISGIDPNQSFYSVNGQKWTDAGATSSGYCFSIKAHTKTLNTSTAVIPTPSDNETPVVPAPDPDAAPEVTPGTTPKVTPAVTPEIEVPDEPDETPTTTPVPVKYQLRYSKNTSLAVGNLPSSASAQKGTIVTIGRAPYCNSRFFIGWNTRADGKGTSYAPGQKIKLTKNITLYAQWTYSYVSSSKLKYRVTGRQTVTCYGTTNNKITKVSIPATIKYKGITYRVTSVWANAFKNRTRLTSVTIGNNVSVIGVNAFYKCKNLKKVTIGTGLTQINANAFRGIKKSSTITIRSLKLKKVYGRIDQSTSRMTVRVPKKKYAAYRKLLRKKSSTVTIKKY